MSAKAESMVMTHQMADGEHPPSLGKSLEGFDLNRKQRLAVDILDGFADLSSSDRTTMFYFFLWHESGSFAPIKQFADIKEDTNLIIDGVLDDDRRSDAYNLFYSQYQASRLKGRRELTGLLEKGETLEKAALRTDLTVESAKAVDRETKIRELFEKPYILDVLRFSKKGLSYAKIAARIGITEGKVGRIRSMLIAQGLIEPDPRGKLQSGEFEAKLNEILPLRERFSIKEIAGMTGYTPNQVRSAFGRARVARRVQALNARKVFERTPYYMAKGYSEIREGVRRCMMGPDNKRRTQKEIADILSTELGREVTPQQVKSQMISLRADGEIEGRLLKLRPKPLDCAAGNRRRQDLF